MNTENKTENERIQEQEKLLCPKAGEQTIKPLEKEIIIELPMPKSEWRRIAFLEAQAKEFERLDFQVLARDIRILLEKFGETRTMKIKGKNVDDLDLEKLGELIQQATKKSSRFNLKGLFKGSKKLQSDITKKQ